MARSGNLLNPNARDAMDRFKMEAAGEVDVPTSYYRRRPLNQYSISIACGR